MDKVSAVVGALIGSLLVRALLAWFAMLCLGAAHSVDPIVPALGYLTVLWLVLALGFATATYSD
jgi:hypothetical protein